MNDLKTLYYILSAEFGPLSEWWVAGSPFERIAGAILVQQTRWENVDRVLSALNNRNLMAPEAIVTLPLEELEEIVRPTGFYRNKAKSLKAVAEYFTANPIEGMADKPQQKLREELLGLRGIGNETADVILLYVAGKPSFVIDAYTKKLCGCMGIQGNYAELHKLFEDGLPRDVWTYQHYHALIVEHGKRYCNKKACVNCAVKIIQARSCRQ
ncbi:endonuclease III domain-containing protein [Methanocella sp. MCL-LM]|uniref:endonuclease III domain-containing protein n=1 Tax=Methanocella sp. MCL-LM TaxID=3412035 RepID=UPI003C736BCC